MDDVTTLKALNQHTPVEAEVVDTVLSTENVAAAVDMVLSRLASRAWFDRGLKSTLAERDALQQSTACPGRRG
jgi:hypothetical protein